MRFKKNLVASAILLILLFANHSMAASAPVSCTYSLTGSECLLTGQPQFGNNLTGNHRDPFINSDAGSEFTFIGEFENEAFWKHDSSSTVLNLEGDFTFDGYSELALGIKQGPFWSVFLVDLSLKSFTFSENDISNIKVYGIAGGSSIVEVSEVPLPAAAWLFLTGLAGVGWMKKRNQKRTLALQAS